MKNLHKIKFKGRALILFACFCMMFIPNALKAQTAYDDVVYLKNGSIIRGVIIENIPGASIKLQTADRSIWVFKMEEIEKMTREEKPKAPVKLSKEKGYYNISSAGLIFDDFSGTLSMVNGYKLSPYFSTGVFFSFDSYSGDLYVPLGIDIRGEILRSSITPYWYLQAGFPVVKPQNSEWETFKPGMMYQPGAGLLFILGKDIGLVTELGYKIQHLTYESRSWGTLKQEIQMRNLTMKVGLQF